MESTEKAWLFCKLCRLIVEGATLVLRRVFDLIVPPQNLHKELQNPEILKALECLKSRRIISVSQWKILFPVIPSQVTSTTFDIALLDTLLTDVLRNARGWSNLPEIDNFNIMADLKRIKMYRDEIYSYSKKTELWEVEYEEIYKNLSKFLLKRGSQEIESAINDLEKGPIDCQEEMEHYMEVLKKWCDQEHNLPTKVAVINAEASDTPIAGIVFI